MNEIVFVFIVCTLSAIYESSRPINYGAFSIWDIGLAGIFSSLLISFLVLAVKLVLQWPVGNLGKSSKKNLP